MIMMQQTARPTPVKYIAEVRVAHEVALLGSADLDYWTEKLAGQRLVPREVDGRAELAIGAMESRWMGVRFRELTIAVSVLGGTPAGDSPTVDAPATYLLRAFNSSALFAWIERTAFQTPYVKGAVRVQTSPPAGICLDQEGVATLRLERGGTEPGAPAVDELWEGAIYLPTKAGGRGARGRVFYARLSGPAVICPFDPSRDVQAFVPHAREPVLGWLVESGFAGRQWHIRDNAVHARSKTFRRG